MYQSLSRYRELPYDVNFTGFEGATVRSHDSTVWHIACTSPFSRGDAMRGWTLTLIVAVTLGLGGCERRDSTGRDEPAAKQAGRAAYNLKQDLKHDARVAADELRRAGKEA